MFDLDHFKALNDRLGHQAGDMALRSVAAATQQQLRATDLLARFGGEEFVVVLPDTDKAHAIETAQRLRKRVGALGIDRGDGASLTASYGVSTFPGGRRRPGQPGRPCRCHDVCRQTGRAQLRQRLRGALSQASGASPSRRRAWLQV
ncbi:MAG: GGDEF domain-containing protein [Rhodocyclaceae bacterium]|nr:GGDEF domain-containing protein [Rhodocyclaceae bacterium]